MKPEIRAVGVIGLGLMGGSLARDLRSRDVQVCAWDRDPENLAAARAEGVVGRALPDDLDGIDDCDLVVLAVPVQSAPALLERIAPRIGRGAAVTDVGSTKRSIADAATRLGLSDRFVGSHPLAGGHRAGWAASRAGLYRAATVFICPSPESSPASVALVRALWRAVGAEPHALTPDEHDAQLAWISHLPQVTASALALTLRSAGIPREALGPGGRDVTRLAGSSPEMWVDILLDNADHVASACAEIGGRLSSLSEAIRTGDAEALRSVLSLAQAWAEER